MDFIKMFAAIYFGIVLSFFTIYGYLNQQAEKALQAMGAQFKESIDNANEQARVTRERAFQAEEDRKRSAASIRWSNPSQKPAP
jgi:hypothetical protein